MQTARRALICRRSQALRKQVPISLPEKLADLPVSGNGPEERSTRFLPLSGKSDGALKDMASQYLTWLDERDNGSSPDVLIPQLTSQDLADAAWMASVGRSHFDYRAGVVFSDAASMRDGLARVTNANGASDGAEPKAATRVAFLYTGDGSQWAGMGEALYDSEPVARAVLDRCDAVVRAERGGSLLDVMFGHPEAAGDLNDAAWGAAGALLAGMRAHSALGKYRNTSERSAGTRHGRNRRGAGCGPVQPRRRTALRSRAQHSDGGATRS